MPCDPKALARIVENIRAHPGSTDYWLDRWLDLTLRATEWDAELWGFDPRWMAVERAAMTNRARGETR